MPHRSATELTWCSLLAYLGPLCRLDLRVPELGICVFPRNVSLYDRPLLAYSWELLQIPTMSLYFYALVFFSPPTSRPHVRRPIASSTLTGVKTRRALQPHATYGSRPHDTRSLTSQDSRVHIRSSSSS
ncbi:hypothetical protein FKP32DRAFT_1223578 [Trametes sanguinea]|nr:hypothetical protein FKP32DRAFT_1223578 [Trametes sanguinea]